MTAVPLPPIVPLADEPLSWTCKLRLTRTDSIDGCRGVLDLDGYPIGRIEFTSTYAADAYQAFLGRLVRQTGSAS